MAEHAVTDDQAIDLLRDLVAIPSPSYAEREAVEFLARWMGAHGYEQAFRDEAGNAVGVRGEGPFTLVLLGHIDTFGGFPPVRVADGKLYGRGAVDAKGALAAFAAAGARATLPDGLRLVVVGAVEEEAPTSAGARHAGQAYRADACIIGEPSQWDRLTLGYKGRLVLRWAWRGALAHSAADVPTAAERAVAYWEQVRAYAAAVNAGRRGLFDRLDATLQDLNTAQDGAFGQATMTVGFRLPPDLTPDALCAALPAADGADLTPYGQEVAFVAPKDNFLTRALRGAIRAQGGQPAFVLKTGTSDMNIVGPAWGCPIVAYGPGDSALDHTPDEHLDLDEYLRAIKVLEGALRGLPPQPCRAAGGRPAQEGGV
ncbi:[LysW]-lysine hydrolase (plasmid) [Aggregatilineales bacterium SYSU G02658]